MKGLIMFMFIFSICFNMIIFSIFLIFWDIIIILEWPLLNFSKSILKLYIYMDMMSMVFIITVSMISLSILFFSISYMMNDKFYARFHWILMLFVFSMYILILTPNLFTIIIGWDGLGLSSYLLVIYYNSMKAYNSGMITLMSNRVGDAFILVSLGLLLEFGDWDLLCYGQYNNLNFKIIMLLMMIAASTKSAQIPFSAWLPAAMAAPTPVSSLVHSSTLVTAGVYLMIRHSFWTDYSNIAYYLLVMGLLSNLMASLTALFETDLKKMVALSTLSQLGIMMLAVGLGFSLLAYLHLLVHASFKALLFVSTGMAIHNSESYQDMRVMGNMLDACPEVTSFMLMCNFSLMGLPFMSAFFSKELILEYILINNHSVILYYLFFVSIILTIMYSMRFIYMFNLRNYDYFSFRLKSGYDYNLMISLYILVLPALMSGYILQNWLVVYLHIGVSQLLWKNFVTTTMFFFLLVTSFFMMKNQKINKLTWFLGSMWSLGLVSYISPMIMSKLNSLSFFIYSEKTFHLYLINNMSNYMMKDNLLISNWGLKNKKNFYFSFIKLMSASTLLLIMLLMFYFNKMKFHFMKDLSLKMIPQTEALNWLFLYLYFLLMMLSISIKLSYMK